MCKAYVDPRLLSPVFCPQVTLTALTLCFSVSPNATVRSSASAPVREGRDSVTLTCEADSAPAPTYIWVRGNGLGEVGRGQVLSLSPASRTDIDTYTCIASNSLGSSAPKSVDVDVYCELTDYRSATLFQRCQDS